MPCPEPFAYAHLLFARACTTGQFQKAPTRDEISLLLYAFMEWGRTKESTGLDTNRPHR
jgi:hypothetical protein